ncbi:hypothetical protein JL721_8396 [Aureococcus anophagefferens]|nr:hypothetical protein JL721_8396 [Aureococcus anophagefferens]
MPAGSSSFDVGGAAVLRYALTKRSFRRGRDVQLPVYYPGAEPHRNYAGARRTDADLGAARAHSLSNGVVVAHADDESDWGGMWSDHYAAVLANSSYALCPGGAAPYASERLVDAIRAGAAPVVVDDGLLVFPFAGLEDADALWARCAVVATPDLMRYGSRGLLRRLDDERDAGLLPARLEACRSLRDRFLGDADAVVDAAFRALAASARTCDAPLPPCAALNSGGTCAGEPVDAAATRPIEADAAGWSHYVLGMLDEQDGLVLDARDHYDAADRLGVARASRHGIQIRDLLAAEPVLLGVETRSWLLKEMATGWRLCGAVACGVSLGDPFEGDHATVYLTTHASNGFPVDFPYVDRPRHANAVVFMEHDARFFPDGGFEKSLEAFRDDADVTLGFAPGAPLAGVPHLPLSYVTDPPGAFATPPVDFDRKAKHVLWVSSQCDPKFARDRLERVDALRAALGPLFASHGACRPTATMEATFPECASLPTDARSGGAATVDDDPRRRCAYRKSAFVAARVAAYENSAAPGYATEKLFQVLAEGSVPVYWGAPDARALLPAPAAAVMVRPGGKIIHEPAPIFLYRRYNESRHWRDLEVLTPAAEERVVSPVEARAAVARARRGRLRRLPRGRLRRRPRLPRRGAGGLRGARRLLRRRRRRRGCRARGYYVDVGFNDARSRTHALDVDRGWRGLCVDPEPEAVGARACAVARVAAGAADRAFAAYARYLGDDGAPTGSLNGTRGRPALFRKKVRTATLGALLDGAAAPPIIDHLHVDTAGSEAEVLRGFPHHARCARRVSVSAAAAPKSQRRVHVFLEAHGYVFEGTDRGCDVFYGDCGAFAPSEGAPLLALKSPRPGDERGQSVKVALSADLAAAPEVRRDPDAYDVCFDCGFGKSCHGLRGGLVLPRCDARELGDGLGRVDAWVERREGSRVGPKVWAWLWDDAATALEALRNKTPANHGRVRLHLGVAHEHLGDGLSGAAEFGAAAALGEPGAAARLAALLDRGAAAPRSACAAEAPRGVRLAVHCGALDERGTTVSTYDYADLALAMGLVDSVLVLHDASVPPLPAILAKFEARFGRDRVVAVAAADVDGVLARDGATHFYVQKAGVDDGLVSAVARTLVHCVFVATQAHGDVYARVSDHVPVDGPASAAAVVPLVVRPGDVDGPDLREELGIAANATVFGRHGGVHTFSIDFVKAVVEARAAARPDVVFLFMNTAPFGAPQPNVRFIPGTADPDRVAAFVRTCDAMLHARAEGETFGLAVADFARHDRPVLTFDSPDPSYARFHLSVLQRRAIPYRDARSLEKALDAFDRDAARRLPRGYWNAYHPAFGPAAVMDAFDRVFLADGPGETFRRPPPANDEGLPAAAAYLAAG